jgi:hypothetical protein
MIAEDQSAHHRLTGASCHRGGDPHDARSLISGQAPDPRHCHGHAYAQDEQAKDQSDPAHSDHVEPTPTIDVLSTSKMTCHCLGELVRGHTT